MVNWSSAAVPGRGPPPAAASPAAAPEAMASARPPRPLPPLSWAARGAAVGGAMRASWAVGLAGQWSQRCSSDSSAHSKCPERTAGGAIVEGGQHPGLARQLHDVRPTARRPRVAGLEAVEHGGSFPWPTAMALDFVLGAGSPAGRCPAPPATSSASARFRRLKLLARQVRPAAASSDRRHDRSAVRPGT